jgi:hypothetical protein
MIVNTDVYHGLDMVYANGRLTPDATYFPHPQEFLLAVSFQARRESWGGPRPHGCVQ